MMLHYSFILMKYNNERKYHPIFLQVLVLGCHLHDVHFLITSSAQGRQELLVVGAGVLGRRVGRMWLERRPGGKVVAATLTEKSHEELRGLGFEALLAEQLSASGRSFQQVVFCAPPSR